MILALDESGDFRLNSTNLHFFVAVHVRPGKEGQFASWENALPRRLKGPAGEFKGSSLPESHLEAFVREVLELEPTVRITPRSIVPAAHEAGAIERHRTYSLATLNDSRIRVSRAGSEKLAKQVDRMAAWLRRMDLSVYLKMTTMISCVTHALSDVVMHAIAGNYDAELPQLEFKIDRDFVQTRDQQSYWQQMLRSVAARHGVVSLDVWEHTGHPFLDLYGMSTPDGQPAWNFTALFRDRCRFLDSKKHFELRIADHVVAIVRRFHSGRGCGALYSRLLPLFCGRDKRVPQLLLETKPEVVRDEPFRSGGA